MEPPILVGFNPRTAAREPVEFGIAASRVTGAPLVILAVRHGGPVVTSLAGSVDDSAGGDARTLEHLRIDLKRRHVAAEVRTHEARSAGGGLTDAIKDLQPAMVVLGATHRGAVGSALLGTTIEHVIHSAARPVAVVPQGYRRPENGVQVVGAAFAPTDEGRAALDFAARLARSASVRLRAIVVLDPKHAEDQAPGLMAEQHREAAPEQRTEARGRLRSESQARDAVAAVAQDLDADVDVLFNDAAEGLVAASRQVDLLVMGSRARGKRRAVVLGSVSRKVAERSACPVVILPRGAAEAADKLVSHAEAIGSS